MTCRSIALAGAVLVPMAVITTVVLQRRPDRPVRGARFVTALTGNNSGVYGAAFSPDGKTLASGGDDKTVRLGEFLR